MTNVQVTYADGKTVDNVVPSHVAGEMFASYQREVDHPDLAVEVGSVPVTKVMMVG